MRINAEHNNQQARSQKRTKNRFRLFLALCGGCLVVLICIILLLPAAFGTPKDEVTDKPSAFGVTGITVVGNTRYDEEAILGVSGIEPGQSVVYVNKRKVVRDLKNTFYYMENVTVDIDMKRHVTITITEAQPMGVVYAEGQWVVVSHKGVGLQSTPIESETPLRGRYIKGAGVLTSALGKQVLDEDSSELIAEIFDALKAADMADDITEIDIENRLDIRLNWKNQITLLMGNDSNLRYAIAAASSALPKVLDKHGETATGHLNLTQYADPTIESPAIVFTPSSLLDQKK